MRARSLSPATALLGLAPLVALTSAQGADFLIPSNYTTWDNDNWVLTTDQLIQGQFQSRAPIANGYFGCGVAAAGPFFEADVNLTDPNGGALPINGWPLDNPRQTFCTISGFFNVQHNTTRTNFPALLERGGESVIAGVPNWPNLILQVGDAVLDATVDNTTISNFKSSRSLKNGLMQWTYDWSPSSDANMSIAYEMFMDRSNPNVAAIRLTVTSGSDMNATVTDLIDGRGAVRSTPRETGMLNSSNTIYSAVSPHWLPDIYGWIYSTLDSSAIMNGTRQNASESFYSASNESTIGQAFPISLKANTATVITKYVGVASSDGFDNPQDTAMQACMNATQTGFDTLFSNSAAAWAELMDEDMVDEYMETDGSAPLDENVLDMQIISKANAHYLLQSLGPSNNSNLARWSISVGGLTSDSYAGLIFWDADTFMSPGVSVSHPTYSYQIPNYRVHLSGQAMANAVNYSYSEGSVLFPWTSGRYGNCTGTGPCIDYEYHINNDIFLNNVEYWRINANDEWFKSNVLPINDGVLQMYSQLMKFNTTVNGYSIQNLTDPDEYANMVPDGAYTLAAVAKDMELAIVYASQFNVTLPSNYSDIAAHVALPFAPSGVLSEYLGANNTAVIKQDDVDLISYPLDYSSPNYTQADKLTSLNYYANLQSPDGPAMTFSLYSISANALSLSGCSAYTYALVGFQPYTRAPWYQFSEQQVDNPNLNGGTNPAFPFMTGAGGWHQVGPMGWLGMRIVEEQLVIQPSLPPQIPMVSLRTVIFAGTGLKATMNFTHTTLTRVDVTKYLPVNATDKYAGQRFPFTVGFSLTNGTNMTIGMGETMTIDNRVYAYNITTSGNILQCQPATSDSDTYPGQYALAAVDGSSTTRWQPSSLNATSMTVYLKGMPYQSLSGASFDWGARPPASVRITVYNATSNPGLTTSENLTVIDMDDISISRPYDAATDAIIRPYVGNASFFSFSSSIYSADYVSLTIAGCLAGDGEPATVGEFNLFTAEKAGDVGDAAAGAGTNGTSVPVTTVGPRTTTGVPSQVATSQVPTGAAASSNTASVIGGESVRAVMMVAGLVAVGMAVML